MTLIDYFGPCIVPAKKWNNVALVKTACGRGETNDKFEELFTTSDEAFLLLVLDNYAVRWYVELVNKIKPVRSRM